jgi:hypothetical protein
MLAPYSPRELEIALNQAGCKCKLQYFQTSGMKRHRVEGPYDRSYEADALKNKMHGSESVF